MRCPSIVLRIMAENGGLDQVTYEPLFRARSQMRLGDHAETPPLGIRCSQ